MAPMTRSKATDDLVPTEAMAAYYERRAAAGLLITEATIVSPDGQGYANTPGIYSLKGHPKTGQRRSPQNRPMKAARDQVVLPRVAVIGQARFSTPTPWATLKNVAMMEEEVEHGRDGGTIAQ